MGTYADGPATFPSPELRNAAVGLVRSHSRLGTTMLAGLFRPGAGEEAARLLAGVLRESADPGTAADRSFRVRTSMVCCLYSLLCDGMRPSPNSAGAGSCPLTRHAS